MFDNVLAIIPARGGSKRLPHKNTLPVGGIPLSKRTILIAKSAGLKKIIVTTDDPAVKEITLKEDIAVIDRPEELATDEAKTEDAILHTMYYVETQLNWNFDTICLLQVTSPLLKPLTLQCALEEYQNRNAISLIAVDPNYKPCGAFYIIQKNTFLKQKTFWIENMGVYVLSAEEAIDVDYIWNWGIANAVINGRVI